MNSKTMTIISAGVLVLLVLLFVANPQFVKEHPVPVVIALLLVGWKLVTWAMTGSREAAADAEISSRRQETESVAIASGSAATVYVYRPSSFAGAVNSVLLHCDDAPAANLKNGSYAVLHLPAGEHKLTIAGSTSEINLLVTPAEEQYIRFSYLKGKLEQLPASVARPEIGKLSRVGS